MEARLLLLSGRSASIGGTGGIGKPLLVRFALDHHQPPAAVSVRHRDTLDAMAALLRVPKDRQEVLADSRRTARVADPARAAADG